MFWVGFTAGLVALPAVSMLLWAGVAMWDRCTGGGGTVYNPVRYDSTSTPEDDVHTLLADLGTPAEQRALLRDANWDTRCACGEYGRPYGAQVDIVTDHGVHGPQLCQPTREWIDPRRT